MELCSNPRLWKIFSTLLGLFSSRRMERNYRTSRLVTGVQVPTEVMEWGSIDRLLGKPHSIASVVRGFLLADRAVEARAIRIEIEEATVRLREALN